MKKEHKSISGEKDEQEYFKFGTRIFQIRNKNQALKRQLKLETDKDLKRK